jgi:ABC-type branched-subunit amino acid transport system permease subunit
MKTDSFFRKERTALVLAVLAVVGVPVLNAFGFVSDVNLNLMGRYFCFALAALGIDLIWGYTGILSLCQAIFFCMGGYCIGMHMLLKTGTKSVYGSALPDFMVWNQVKELPWFWDRSIASRWRWRWPWPYPWPSRSFSGSSHSAAASKGSISPSSPRLWP